ncbi:MAG: TonB-dependent receptor plug domain-containing protein [Thermoanaerobaculia bacterium]|nr:TonB-dependent receptor plug domain-containing protein [Thermoanaerobaculia bacterium]
MAASATAQTTAAEPTEALPTYVETVTVSATASPTQVADVAGTVGRIDRAEIERQNAGDARDLLRFEPGIDVTGDPTRLGLGGFVIRGIGGNRVQTRAGPA